MKELKEIRDDQIRIIGEGGSKNPLPRSVWIIILSKIGKVKELINLACDIVTDDETGANIQYMLCNFKTVARNYPNTDKGQLVRGKCDNLYDHHAESYRSR